MTRGHPAPNGVTIRVAVPRDADAIAAVHRAAFPADEGLEVARLVDALRVSPGGVVVPLIQGHVVYPPAFDEVASIDHR